MNAAFSESMRRENRVHMGNTGMENGIRDREGLTEEEFLAAYQPGDYPRPSVATDMVIFTVMDREEENYRKLPEKELRLLLIKRGGHPFLGCWALPGGFVRPTETTEQAAERELREETGVKDVYLEQLYTFSQPGRDPRMWVMSCSYMALVDSSQVVVQAGDDADQAAWFKVQCQMTGKEKGRETWELLLFHEGIRLKTVLEKKTGESFAGSRIVRCEEEKCEETGEKEDKQEARDHGKEGKQETRDHEKEGSRGHVDAMEGGRRTGSWGGVAFDHGRIIAYGLERLRGKLQYTDLALHLMPEHFTLTQLQQVYEVILDREMPAAAFRRKAAPLVEETPNYTENKGHRPSRLYRKKNGRG